MTPAPKFGSIEHSSLIRKFTILFIVMSLLPFIVIVYLFIQVRDTGRLELTPDKLFLLMFLTGCGALAGFYGMRRSIGKIQKLTRQITQIVSKDIPGVLKADGEESEITQMSRAFNEVTKNLEDNIQRLESSKRTMQYVLSKLASGISSTQTIDTFLELIVEITANALDARIGVLMLLDEARQELYVKSASGFDKRFIDLRLKIGEEGPGWSAKHKKPLLIPALEKIKSQDEKDPFAPPLLCAPLLYKDNLVGVLAVGGKITSGNFNEDELLIIANLASQTAIAVENDRLHLDAEKTYMETISALALAVEARDPYSRGHSDRVSNYAVKIADKLGLSEDLVKDIKDAAELHDVGKIGIADSILKKAGALDEEEMRVMRTHPIIGEGIVKPVRTLSSLCDIIRHHHEILDGSGYPDGLKGDEISIGARILAVADSFDAMTTDRPYRKGLSFPEAREELKKCVDVRYDRKVVEVFNSIV